MDSGVKQIGSTSKLIIHYPPKLWLGNISKKFPNLKIEITAFVPININPFIGNSMIRIIGIHLDDVLKKLEQQPSLISYSIMKRNPTELTLNTRTKDNFLLKSIVKNGILVQLPVKVIEGTAEFIIDGGRSQIDNFITDLNSKGIKVDIINLTCYTTNIVKAQLTPKQYQIYQSAKKAGYYDTPRKITLTELAAELNLAKSSLSGMLQRIHKKLLGN
ncbi:MAG: helix-turn-helix domain-containing protein [Promethearchaeota archaeon]